MLACSKSITKSAFKPTWLVQFACTHQSQTHKLLDCNFVHTVDVTMPINQTGLKHAWLSGDKIRQSIKIWPVSPYHSTSAYLNRYARIDSCHFTDLACLHFQM